MNNDEKLTVTERTKLRRFPIRGHFDKETIYGILDRAPLAHIGFQHTSPSVLPMMFWRKDDHVYFHGSSRNRMFAALSGGSQCCLVATLIDAFVAARAALHHSVNYRCVMIYGEAQSVSAPDEKLTALQGLIERFYPGRWSQIRPPSASEYAMVSVYRLPISEASAKVRTGFPTPYPEDFKLPVWAGVIPLTVGLGEPQIDPNCAPGTPTEDFAHLRRMLTTQGD